MTEDASKYLKSFHSSKQCLLSRLDSCNPFFEWLRMNPTSCNNSVGEISATVATVANSLALSTSKDRVEVKCIFVKIIFLAIVLIASTEYNMVTY